MKKADLVEQAQRLAYPSKESLTREEERLAHLTVEGRRVDLELREPLLFRWTVRVWVYDGLQPVSKAERHFWRYRSALAEWNRLVKKYGRHER